MNEGRNEGMMLALYCTDILHRRMTSLVYQLREAMPVAVWVRCYLVGVDFGPPLICQGPGLTVSAEGRGFRQAKLLAPVYGPQESPAVGTPQGCAFVPARPHHLSTTKQMHQKASKLTVRKICSLQGSQCFLLGEPVASHKRRASK